MGVQDVCLPVYEIDNIFMRKSKNFKMDNRKATTINHKWSSTNKVINLLTYLLMA